MKISIFILSLIIGLFGAGVAFSYTPQNSPPKVQAYISLDGGASILNKQSIYIPDSQSYSSNQVNLTVLGGAFGVKWRVPGMNNGGFRAELAYRYSSGYSDSNNVVVGNSVYNEMLNGYWDVGRFQGVVPYIGGGAGFSNVNVTSADYNQTGTKQAGSTTNLSWLATFGVNYEITNNWDVGVGYSYVNYGKTPSLGLTPASQMTGNQILLRLSYNF